MKNKRSILILGVILLCLVFFLIGYSLNYSKSVDADKNYVSDNDLNSSNSEVSNLKGKECFELICSNVDFKYDEYTYSKTCGDEVIYEAITYNFCIEVFASKENDLLHAIRVVSLNEDKTVYYAVENIDFQDIEKSQIEDFLSGLGGASIWSPNGKVQFKISVGKDSGPILDITFNES